MIKSRWFFLLIFIPLFSKAQLQRFQFTEPKMGSPFRLIFYAADSVRAAELAHASFALVDSLNHIFSDYDSSSELNALNRAAGGNWIAVSEPLFTILEKSKRAASKSKNAFDITIGPLSAVWRASRRARTFPADSIIQQAVSKTGIQYLQLDATQRRAKLFQKAMRLDLGGIAKGYTAEAVVRYLASNNIASALLDAGGDIFCSAAPPNTTGWTIGINVPEQESGLLHKTLLIQHKAVASSGDAYQYTERNGKKYSHIIDPRTGYGVTFQRNVTVIANDGATADWLATACSILPIRDAKKLARRQHAALLIGTLEGDQLRFYSTRRMKRSLHHR